MELRFRMLNHDSPARDGAERRVDLEAYEFGIRGVGHHREVNLFDFASWAECFTGPNCGPFDAGCEALDFDGNLDVDWADFGGMQTALGTP